MKKFIQIGAAFALGAMLAIASTRYAFESDRSSMSRVRKSRYSENKVLSK